MHQRDYILRLIEQLGSVLSELRRRILRRREDPSEIERDLAGLAGQAGLDLELLRGFAIETLHMFVAPTGEVEPARCWMMAEVLFLDGLQAEAEGRSVDAVTSLAKARMLFSFIEPGGGMLVGLEDAGERIVEIDAVLERVRTELPREADTGEAEG